MEPLQGSVLCCMFITDVTVATIMEPSSGFGVTLPVYHGRYRGYYNGTLSGLGIAALRYCGRRIITV